MSYKEFKKEDNTKNKIIKLLMKEPLCIGDITEKLNISQPAVSDNCKKLFDEGILIRKQIKNFVFYGVDENKLKKK